MMDVPTSPGTPPSSSLDEYSYELRQPKKRTVLSYAHAHSYPSGRSTLDVLQLSVQQEGEADMDVELMRKGLLAVKMNKSNNGGGNKQSTLEEEDGLMMPGTGYFKLSRARNKIMK